jgi:hypothetical protein
MEANIITGTQRPEERSPPPFLFLSISHKLGEETKKNPFSKDNIKERKQSV